MRSSCYTSQHAENPASPGVDPVALRLWAGVERPVSGGECRAEYPLRRVLDRPKHLDPAQSYTEDELTFTGQIYEPPLQYHYLKRPYELIPATLEGIPHPRFLDDQGRELSADAPLESIAESV